MTPGKIFLAHNGVHFFDELTEFSRHVLDQLRELLRTLFQSDAPSVFAAASEPPTRQECVALRQALAHALPDRVARLASLSATPAEAEQVRTLSEDLSPALVRRAYVAAEQV